VIDQDEDHPFLTSRHIDDLTEAIRNLSRLITQQSQHHHESIDMQRRQLEVQRETRDATEKLLKALTYSHTNGAAGPP
jgi:hypothetical protein